jgi:N-acetylmuramoyl-L-alanine amidase
MAAPEGDVVVVPDEAMVKSGNKSLAKVQPYSMPLGGRVVLTLSEPARYEAGMLEPDATAGRGHRIYLDLFDVRFKGIADHVDGKGFISGVRLGKRKFGTRVVIDLSDAATRRVFYLPDPFRVVIDLSTRVAASTARKVDDGKRFVTRVALDPGHGGWDAGAIGPTGLREKDVALDVAHRAAPALASELGIETMLTRDTDTFIELDERTARANAFQSDLFISIHCNATENGQASGLEVFIVDPSREQDAATLRAVARENHRKGAVMDPQLLDAQLSTIARGLGMGRNSHASRTFADLLRKSSMGSLSERFPFTADHGTKTASFFVLVGTEMPSVLYETAFISNPDDEARLATADYRQKLADAIVNAIRAYRDGLR